mmetsp:Transcript_579/g.723  ORF Transcript_579/g.723 Transcript_579/m.723 type:complete len:366 (-) Transcript_579:921-2018(-)|eukprot:CAMPEP_0175079698 /NCGR_PEP_ID=MMETSP0052_2-20121109/24982_1 /TAXON_ID=51329 ORGANISM="Polytomella parva, Strain SAG 63-3" /NCGR_SAMPLE_ID=MMETSP0052_2 /ASSEMBLY_ACC=CAM_ASM_000194 /LENGTH=365 /DNA_ID=CAMNT_0016350087 /DNA_START=389 /DNA_END=1486 /DNA_ORIENTATION=+
MGACSGHSHEVGIGMACCFAAGFATIIGALFIVFVRVRNARVISAAIAFATGVMLYISFVDIYIGKGVANFEEAGYSTADSFLYATLCFFGGFPLTYGLDFIANRILEMHNFKTCKADNKSGEIEAKKDSNIITVIHPPTTVGDCTSPIATTNTIATASTTLNTTSGDPTLISNTALAIPLAMEEGTIRHLGSAVCPNELDVILSDEDCYNFAHAGLLAGMAIAVHNCPEGLVTFVSYFYDSSMGVSTAFAIAIHNIPEGMVVAFPIFYATNSKWQAIFWAALSGATEPVGALIGLAVACGGSLTNTVFGILFGLIAGIMVYVSLVELYPRARKYDSEDRITSKLMALGMIVMATSLVVINYADQ